MAIQIKLSKTPKIKVKTKIVVPECVTVIDDVDLSDVKDGYVLIFNDNLKKYQFVDPDDVLSKSVQDDFLPPDFLNQLDNDLNNRVDFDGGEF